MTQVLGALFSTFRQDLGETLSTFKSSWTRIWSPNFCFLLISMLTSWPHSKRKQSTVNGIEKRYFQFPMHAILKCKWTQHKICLLLCTTLLMGRISILIFYLWVEISGLGRYIALRYSLALHHPNGVLWWLQIWDWKYLTTSDESEFYQK